MEVLQQSSKVKRQVHIRIVNIPSFLEAIVIFLTSLRKWYKTGETKLPLWSALYFEVCE